MKKVNGLTLTETFLPTIERHILNAANGQNQSFPSNISVQGSPPTPYIFDDRCSAEDAAQALLKVYNYGKEERERRGDEGRKWATGDEAKFTAEHMSNSVIEILDRGFDSFVPRQAYEFFTIKERPRKTITHKITGY